LSTQKENNQNDNSNDGVKKMKIMLDDQMKIRNQIIEEFRKRNLEVPVHMIGKSLVSHCAKCKSLSICFIDIINRSETSKTNRNHAEHWKELYTRLSEYLDRRQIRNHSQTYIFPDLIYQMIRCRFLNDIRAYQTVKTFKNGKLNDVTEGYKYRVQWQDFCKKRR